LTKTDEHGDSQELDRWAAAQHVGEVTLFDNSPGWFVAIASQDCTLLKLDQNRFIRLIAQRPQIVLEICQFLSQQLRESGRYRTRWSPPTVLSPN
jgi:CRP-like cAMP-binding protein